VAEAPLVTQLVVVGSSAGGIDALSRLVAELPPDFAAPIVLAQHLDPQRPSHLAEILGRRSRLPVQLVENSEALRPGVIYVVPSNRNVEITDHHVGLTTGDAAGPRPSVDVLLASAARAFGENLIAIVLTGSGSDGAAGARSVKAAGGTVIIQDPRTASFPSMPASLAPSTVDIVADVDAMGPLLADLVAGTYSPVDAGADDMTALLRDLREQSGLDFSTYKQPTIARRLERRMAATGSATFAAYRELLQSDADEARRLVGSFLIKVTEFFRDADLFEALRTAILPRLIDEATAAGSHELRIWSAGCATGEEAYSVAIALAQVLGDRLPEWKIRIFATDLDEAAIEFARRGVYPISALDGVPKPIVQRYFTASDGSYALTKPIRSMLVFGQHDLAQRAPFPRTDLVLCRNVLIYFTPELQRRTLQLFAFSLRDGGVLILGKAETTTRLSSAFALEDMRLKVYRRQGARVMAPLTTGSTFAPTVGSESRAVRAAPPSGRRFKRDPESLNPDSLLRQLPIGIVRIDANYDIVSINPAAAALLQIRGVAVGKDLVHLAHDIPSNDLRNGIEEALAGRRWSHTFEVPSPNVADRGPAWIRLETHRFPVDGEVTAGAARGAIVVIEDVTAITAAAHADADERAVERTQSDSVAEQARRLLDVNRTLVGENEELREANATLRGQAEELMVANEESQATNEEVETLNEELQATNEELETLNEELQATNEELHTTHDDMQARTVELQELAQSLEGLQKATESERARFAAVLAGMRDAVVVLDATGQPILQNDAYTRLVEHGEPIPEDEHGEPLSDETPLRARAARGETFTTEFRAMGGDGARHWYEVAGQPIDVNDVHQGGVLVLHDITERSLRRLQNEFIAIVAHELRTPLTALRGYLQLLDRQTGEAPESRAAAFTGLALDQANRLQELIGDLFDTARMDAGKLSFHYAEADLGTLIREAVDSARTLSDQHVIDVAISGGDLRVRADTGRLQQVLLNVISNAMTHAAAAERIDVRVDREGEWGIVSVIDRGPGIPADELPQLFARYRQGPGPGRGGLGLGLFIAREIVTAHGGEIEALSTPGTGTTIRFRLPLLTSNGGSSKRTRTSSPPLTVDAATAAAAPSRARPASGAGRTGRTGRAGRAPGTDQPGDGT
jgi:two-component system CheB/CheR fusion protein